MLVHFPESSVLFFQDKVVKTERGYLVRIVIKIHRLPNLSLVEFPQGYKFKWMVWRLGIRPREYIRIDNHKGKGPHFHYDNQQEFFTWISLAETEKLFFTKVYQRFGYFYLD